MQGRIFRVDKLGVAIGLGPLEARVMDIVWTIADWASVNDVMAKLQYKRGEKSLAYTTVKTVLQNLADKQHLKKRSAGKANEFRAVQSRDEFQRSIIDDVVGPLLRTQRNPLLAHIAGELAADDESLAEFERLIAMKRAERADA
jgi:predicted transcriptional regulator